ncbi:peptide-n4-(n-acetyl-beta-glucosaminyl)asparagine amidase a [Phlyctema vagabunda]|uniref:Peptide-n4-(N-acetyl-beta-glucosaminyl)asparagine amidase a n=1 Tax=Phlyctema vagabunda TaxID=108571 RepID=A0ABR4P1J9_9HELO
MAESINPLPKPMRIMTANLPLPLALKDCRSEPAADVVSEEVEGISTSNGARYLIFNHKTLPTSNHSPLKDLVPEEVPLPGVVLPGGINVQVFDIGPHSSVPAHRTTSTDYLVFQVGEVVLTTYAEAYDVETSENRTDEWARVLTFILSSEPIRVLHKARVHHLIMKVNVLATLLWGLAAKFAFAQPSADVYRADNTSSGVLEVVQAQVPPRTSYAKPACKQVVFNHNFANSYGVPYVGTYSPPASCNYTTTIFNMSVTSAGRQYDRLALLFLDDIEVWRTSTAMPNPTGIHWSYQKDMSIFDSLLRSEKKVIFDLSNVYSDLYTGAFNVTLEALYFGDVYDHLEPADLIYPISALASSRNISSVMSLPDDNGTVSITLPRNVKTAVVSLLASGNGAEEFWYTNVPSEYVETFPSNPSWLYGYSPFREVELLIDGQLAGVTWPFPILFTGGVVRVSQS